MIYTIQGEQPFQVLSESFSVSPSESGYDLYLSADGFNYSQFATVASGVTRQFTSMNEGNYYKLIGNTGEVKVNWMKDCSGGGGGGTAGVSSLDGQTGALTTKTVGGQSILGSGDIPISGGKTVVNFDGTTQAERATLYTTLKALYDAGSGNTINKTYAFYKTLNSNQGVPFDYYEFDSANTLILGAVVTSGNSTAYEQVLKIASDGSVTVSTNAIGGGAAGPTVINLDSLSQSELVDLYNALSGTTSADTINSNYVFLKAFENGDYGPYRLQMTGMPWGNRVCFASVITNPWNNSEITYLNAVLQSDGSLSENKSNFAVSLGTLRVLRDQAWTKYDFTTSAATCSGGATIATGDTCSGPWAFEIVNTKHYADGEFDNNINNMAPVFNFRITDTDSSDKRYSNPILHYDTITTVVLNDSDGNPHNFNYKFYFDYGDFVVTLLANEDEYRYARFTVTKRQKVQGISRADYEALVAAGTVDTNTLYVIN